MIQLEQVTFAYPLAAENATAGARWGQPVLQNITLQIDAGEFVLLVGPSGAGKSTLLRLLNGLAPHFTGGRLSGQVRVHGLDPVQATPRLMSRHVGFVFQDPEAQFVMDRVEDELAFGLEQAALSPQAMRLRVEETLALLDLSLIGFLDLMELLVRQEPAQVVPPPRVEPLLARRCAAGIAY